MKVHILKTWPEYFEAIYLGIKTFEWRINDRDFKVGDQLILKEYNAHLDEYSGRTIKANVTYILDVTNEKKVNRVVMSIVAIDYWGENDPQ